MASTLVRALSRVHLSSTTRLCSLTPIVTTRRPAFSFSQSVACRPCFGVEAVAMRAFEVRTVGSKSAEKRHRQSEKRRKMNKARKTEVKTRMKRVFKAIDAFKRNLPKEISQLDHIKPLMDAAFKTIDKAVTKHAVHRNTAARRKSRLTRYRERLLVQAGLIPKPEKPKVPSLLEAYEARKAARRAALKAGADPTNQA